MVKAGIILKDPESFLDEVLKSQSLTTFKKKYWGLFYYYEYTAMKNKEKIHELKKHRVIL